MRIVSSLVILTFSAATLHATTGDEVLQAIQQKVTLTKVSLISESISKAGTPLVVQ